MVNCAEQTDFLLPKTRVLKYILSEYRVSVSCEFFHVKDKKDGCQSLTFIST